MLPGGVRRLASPINGGDTASRCKDVHRNSDHWWRHWEYKERGAAPAGPPECDTAVTILSLSCSVSPLLKVVRTV